MSQFDCSACKAIGKLRHNKDIPVCKETGADCLIDRTKKEHRSKLSQRAIDVYTLFGYSGTQWRYSFGGPTGLDYVAVKLIADTLEIDFSDRRLFILFQLCEVERLNYLESERKKKESK